MSRLVAGVPGEAGSPETAALRAPAASPESAASREPAASPEPAAASSAIPPLRGLRSDIRIAPLPGEAAGAGRLLVELADRTYLVSPATAGVLAALAEGPKDYEALAAIVERRTGRRVSPARLREIVTGGLPPAFFATELPPRRTALRLKLTLIPERLVTRLARHLTWCFDRRIAATVLILFVLVVAATIGRAAEALLTVVSGLELLALYGAVLFSVLVHEFGHAAASLRGGSAPGRIGIGLYLIVPALFTDVTRVWRLPARQRIVVDLGGLYFQCVLMISLGVCGLLTSGVVFLQLFWITLFSMVYTLNPVFKMDGYWLLSDLTGLPNLHRRMAEGTRALLRPSGNGGRTGRGGAPPRLVILYLALVLLHAAIIGDLIVRSFPEKILQYPQTVARAVDLTAGAWSRAAFREVGQGVGRILAASLWPACLAYLAIRLVTAVARFVRGCRVAAGARGPRAM